MLITSHGHTDVGFVREKNEDSFIVDEGKGIYAVADGVGGLPYGSLASRLAVRFYGALMHGPESCSTLEELRSISHEIQTNLLEFGALVGGENGIGTTFSGLRIIDSRLLLPMSVILRFFSKTPVDSVKYPKTILLVMS